MGSASKYKADNHRLELIKKLGIKNLKLRDFDLDLVVEGEPIFLDFELISAYSGHDNTGVYMKTESGAILKIEFTDYDYERLMIGLK